MRQGMIQIYCGDGKGKTTAATGLAGKIIVIGSQKGGSYGTCSAGSRKRDESTVCPFFEE